MAFLWRGGGECVVLLCSGSFHNHSLYFLLTFSVLIEPEHDKINKMSFVLRHDGISLSCAVYGYM